MLKLQKIIDALEAERDEAKKHLSWLDARLAEFRKHGNGQVSTAGQGTGRKAPKRRATSNRSASEISAPSASPTRQGPTKRESMKPAIIAHLTKHPGSTAGDIAKALRANRNTVATRLSQMVKHGEIHKADKGYQAK